MVNSDIFESTDVYMVVLKAINDAGVVGFLKVEISIYEDLVASAFEIYKDPELNLKPCEKSIESFECYLYNISNRIMHPLIEEEPEVYEGLDPYIPDIGNKPLKVHKPMV